ncbi:MAG: Ig-like domain-containing protein, partial [Patescibacteria group bacterium]
MPAVAAVLTAVTPTLLSGEVGTQLTPAPTIRASDQNGNPVQGVTVSFRITVEGKAVRTAIASTGSDGTATVAWLLDERAGSYVINAESHGLPSVGFSVTARPGPAAILARVQESQWQSAVLGTALALPLTLKLGDRFENPIAGAAVTFVVLSGGGS